MRRFVLGTAGHVDHGKTTLVRALTGVDTDRLPEEKRRGITIELGFASWHITDDISVSIIDVPGHKRLVHTMIAGAIGMEIVLLVIAADEGVMPQTREHIAACEILGIRRAIVAITKLDRTGPELAALAAEEATQLLGQRFETQIVYCSARTGEGIDPLRDTVRRALTRLPPPRPSARARLSVDRVFSVRGAGTVVTGTLVEGTIKTGDPLYLVGATGAQPTTARALHIHDRSIDRAEAPTRLAVNLAGLPLETVHRGDLLTNDPGARPTRTLDVALTADIPLRRGAILSVYIGTARSTARVDPFGLIETETGDRILARLRLIHPLVALGGDRFVLRGADLEGPAGAVIGGGIVLDAAPPRRRPRDKRRSVAAALTRSDAPATIRALVDEAAPRPLPHAAIPSRFVIPETALRKAADSLVGKGELTALKGHGWLTTDHLHRLAATARALTLDHQKKAPLDRGIGLETLRRKLADIAGLESAEAAIRLAAQRTPKLEGDPLLIEGDIARLPGASTMDHASRGALEAAQSAVCDAGLRGVTEFAVKELTGASPREVKAILAKLVRDNLAVHGGDLWFSRPHFDELRARVLAHFERAPRLTIADLKDMTGLGRKQVILLLELLDRERVTRREGDERIAVQQ